jgi:hypothetical protein
MISSIEKDAASNLSNHFLQGKEWKMEKKVNDLRLPCMRGTKSARVKKLTLDFLRIRKNRVTGSTFSSSSVQYLKFAHKQKAEGRKHENDCINML